MSARRFLSDRFDQVSDVSYGKLSFLGNWGREALSSTNSPTRSRAIIAVSSRLLKTSAISTRSLSGRCSVSKDALYAWFERELASS